MTWQTKQLGDICDILDSKRKPVTQRDRVSGEYPYYGATGIQDYVNDYIFDEKLILIGEDGAKWGEGENTAFIADGKYWVNNHAHVIRPHRNTVLDNWIVYFLNVNDLYKYITGLTVQKLNQGKLRDIEIPIPPLPDQKRILKILDEVFENIEKAKENTEKNLQNSRDLFESYSQEIFETKDKAWEERKLSEVCERITDGTHQTPIYFKSGVIFLSSRNVTSRKIDWENIKYIDTKQHLEMHKRVAPRVNDILLAKNGTTGVAAIVDKNVVFDIYVSLALLRSRGAVTPLFLLYFINSIVAKKQFNKRLKGIGVPNLHLQEIREVVISFPSSIVEQNKIVKKLDALSEKTKKLEEIYKQKLADLEELKKSILQKAFAGEL